MTNYRVSIIRHGTRSTTKSDVFLNYPLYDERDEDIEMDYFVWLIQSATDTWVVDTGFSRAGGTARNRTFLLDLPTVYRTLGIEPESSPTVILTHAHYDHTGNVDFFPTSQIVMAEAEYDFWRGRYATRRQFHHSVEDADLAAIARAEREGRLTLFSDLHEVAPGIEVVRLGGHTPGQSVVRVTTSDGVVLLASDAIHFYEEYERDRPFTYVADLIQMYAAFDRIHDWEAAGAVQHIVSGHDAGTLQRFTPGSGEYADFIATIGELT